MLIWLFTESSKILNAVPQICNQRKIKSLFKALYRCDYISKYGWFHVDFEVKILSSDFQVNINY